MSLGCRHRHNRRPETESCLTQEESTRSCRVVRLGMERELNGDAAVPGQQTIVPNMCNSSVPSAGTAIKWPGVAKAWTDMASREST